ncbi:MAG: hypothetical protein HY688_05250 [Chloroflexi bacterium]|nr:hypothetical protein [Chloroflexota bacterium]
MPAAGQAYRARQARDGGPALVSVTGPMRGMLEGSRLRPYFATPHGDMMLAGCFGLLRAWAERCHQWREEILRALRATGEDLGHH